MPTSGSATGRTRWAGVPADERRAGRRVLLLDAGFDLLGTEGWSGTTVRAVCHRARLNPRYFYESFPNLDALVIAVYDRLVEELEAGVVAAMAAAGDDRRAETRAGVEHIVRFVDEDRRRARVLYVEALGNEALNRRRIETGYAVVGTVERNAADRHGPVHAGEKIGRISAAVFVGGLTELLTAWLAGLVDVTREQLVDDATELFLALADATASIAAKRAGNGRRRRR